MAKKLEEKRTRILKFGIANVVAWGDVAACFEAHVTENVNVVFAKGNTNLALIPR